MQDKQFPVLLKGSRYAERLPIGKKEILETFKHDRLKQFYTDWYRPDLMAVIAVGDFEKPAIEALDQEALRRRCRPRDRRSRARPIRCPIIRARSTRSRPTRRRPGANVSVYIEDGAARSDDGRLVPAADRRESVLRHAVRAVRGDRPETRTRRSWAPTPAAALFVRTKEASMLSAAVKEDGIATRARSALHRSRAGRRGSASPRRSSTARSETRSAATSRR